MVGMTDHKAAERTPMNECIWEYDGLLFWITGCGEWFSGYPEPCKENWRTTAFRYCPYCAKPVKLSTEQFEKELAAGGGR